MVFKNSIYSLLILLFGILLEPKLQTLLDTVPLLIAHVETALGAAAPLKLTQHVIQSYFCFKTLLTSRPTPPEIIRGLIHILKTPRQIKSGAGTQKHDLGDCDVFPTAYAILSTVKH